VELRRCPLQGSGKSSSYLILDPKDCEEGDTSHPKLTVKIKEYNFVDDVPRYGQNRRIVSAAVEFKLKFPDMEIKAPDTITDKAVNVRKTGLSMLTEMEMANEVAANISHKFAKQLIPTIKNEFREFFVDGTDVDKAVHLAENNNWDLAIDIWESIVARDNKNAGAYYNLGIAYEHEREFIKANEAYKNAVRIDYNNNLFSKYRGKFVERRDVRAELENDREAIDNGTQESIKKLF
jgi:tetratricopeptide (TPR) repeat protein